MQIKGMVLKNHHLNPSVSFISFSNSFLREFLIVFQGVQKKGAKKAVIKVFFNKGLKERKCVHSLDR